MQRRRKWQPTPVFLPGESQGCSSLVGCRLWGRTESDTLKDLAAAAAEEPRTVVPHDFTVIGFLEYNLSES